MASVLVTAVTATQESLCPCLCPVWNQKSKVTYIRNLPDMTNVLRSEESAVSGGIKQISKLVFSQIVNPRAEMPVINVHKKY